jgi:HSP20 family protein
MEAIMKKFISWFAAGIIALALVSGSASRLFARETAEDLKEQIRALRQRVDDLEAELNHRRDDDLWGGPDYGSGRQWDPFTEMRRMQEEMNRLFQNSFSRRKAFESDLFSGNPGLNADMDVTESAAGYEIRFDLKGVNRDKLDIQINQNSITVKGEYSREDTEEEPDAYLRSRSFGSFLKTIPLPVDADTSRVKTEKEGYYLVINIPRKTP